MYAIISVSWSMCKCMQLFQYLGQYVNVCNYFSIFDNVLMYTIISVSWAMVRDSEVLFLHRGLGDVHHSRLQFES